MPRQKKIKNKTGSGNFENEINYGRELSDAPPGEEVVIAGISGNFPNSRNVQQLQHNLYNKIDMISDNHNRWCLDHPEIPKRLGVLDGIEKFDAGYFGIHPKQATSTDPLIRIFLEKTIEAIMDAGVNPSELEGTNCGVFVGSSSSESQIYWFSKGSSDSHAMTGNQKSMIPNRISYHLKLKGPSIVTDTACSSSLYALEHAYRAIRDGSCDSAIVGGTNLCLDPFYTLQFARLGILSPDGRCKVFDSNGDGYVRAEAVVAIFLQKSNNAKRIYGRVVHVKSNCDGYKEQGITFPSSSSQKRLFEQFYQECNIDPNCLSYMEAHGTGTKVGDPEETDAIDSVFCKNRKVPLLIGSIKSNLGHTEASSGLCSIIKIIIAAENGLIPPNINFSKPPKSLKGIVKGRLKVVGDPTIFEDDRGFFGVNSFGFGGANCHVLLEWNRKTKNNQNATEELPRLVCVSGRVKDGIASILDDIKQRPLDVEYIALYHNLFRQTIKNHLYRGFSIVSKSGELGRCEKFLAPTKKKILFNFWRFWRFLVENR